MKTLLLLMLISPAANAGIEFKQGSYPAYETCAANERLEVFSLLQEEPAKKIEANELPFAKGTFELIPIGEESAFKTRFELCVDESSDGYFLKRIIQQIPAAGQWSTFRYIEIRPEEGELINFFEPLFVDPSKLELRFKNANEPSRSILIKGHSLSDQSTTVTFSFFDFSSGNSLQSSYLHYGNIVPGDPFAKKFTPSHYFVEKGGVRIEVKLEYTGSVGKYISYRVKKIIVDDENAKGGPFHFESELGSQDPHFRIQYSHHGTHDSFNFQFDHAKFTLDRQFLTISRVDSPTSEVYALEQCAGPHSCGTPVLPSRPVVPRF